MFFGGKIDDLPGALSAENGFDVNPLALGLNMDKRYHGSVRVETQ